MAKAPLLLGSHGDSLREAFGRAITNLAEKDERIVVLDADIAGGTGAHHFRKAFPKRFIQCGIAEQNMMAMAGGLSATGLVPFVTTFAVFMIRAAEQARLSVAYANMNVKIIASHPGLDVGPDGASAQCLEDLAVYRAIPNMVVLSPADPLEIESATRAILEYEGPVYMRTGRSPAPEVFDSPPAFEIGKGTILKDGHDLTVMSCGVMTKRALEAADKLAVEGISARVVHMPTLKPIDADLIIRCARETGGIVSAEDHNVIGGLGGAIAEVLAKHYPAPMEFIGVNDSFGESGEADELAAKYKIDDKAIVEVSRKLIERIS